jgi:hypothetical protein
MVFQAEAEVRWLDHCEASLVRYTSPPASPLESQTQPAAVADTEVEQEVPR